MSLLWSERPGICVRISSDSLLLNNFKGAWRSKLSSQYVCAIQKYANLFLFLVPDSLDFDRTVLLCLSNLASWVLFPFCLWIFNNLFSQREELGTDCPYCAFSFILYCFNIKTFYGWIRCYCRYVMWVSSILRALHGSAEDRCRLWNCVHGARVQVFSP